MTECLEAPIILPSPSWSFIYTVCQKNVSHEWNIHKITVLLSFYFIYFERMYNPVIQCSLLRNAVDERWLLFAVTNGTDEETCCLWPMVAVTYILCLMKQFLILYWALIVCVCSMFNTEDIAHSPVIYNWVLVMSSGVRLPQWVVH